MSDEQKKFWKSTQFYKSFLPLKDAIAAREYVILASRVDPGASPAPYSTSSNSSSPALSSVSNTAYASNARPVAADISFDADEFANFSAASQTQSSDAQKEGGYHRNPAQTRVAFYVYRKRDVAPPPLKYTLSPKQVNHCFFVCEREQCNCECPHAKPGAWRLRADELRRTAMTVTEKGQNRRLLQREIVPTAGYFYALALLHQKAVHAVVPTLCRFNRNCKHGSLCLYIHADVDPTACATHAAEIHLREWSGHVVLDVLDGSQEEQNAFFNYLDDEGITTVGDLQVLGDAAFESLATAIRHEWAEAFLITSNVRNFDYKALLTDVLATFPRVQYPLQLPESLVTVGDLLSMAPAVFYHLQLTPHVMDAMEMIRDRCNLDEMYNVITLSKEPAESFFSKVTSIINKFRGTHAHNSWRKHDPTRPVVTSLITYVDVTSCHCGEEDHGRDSVPFPDEMPSLSLIAPSPEEGLGVPKRSWCRCPRMWEIGVNYELSTPSGSRCSEQNVMGKLASLGVPTWAVRDIFVHGMNVKKEANPLFPCGVCENMLQKVNKDVEARYGGDITLYMFDATAPKKIVYLPVQEISHRDGHSFKRFVAQDLRV